MKPLALKWSVSILALVMTTALVRTARAERINVNMYNSNGTPVPEAPSVLVGPVGGLDEAWNQFNTTSGSGLNNSSGAATTVGYNNNVGTGWYRGTGASLNMLRSGRAQFGKGADTTHTINGLTPGTKYDIWIASCEYNDYDPETGLGEWSTPNPTVTFGPQHISNLDLNGATWEYGNNFILLEQVVADGNGEIVLLGDAADAD